VCRFISLLRHTPPQEQVFQELKKLSDIRFRFVERSRPAAYVSDVSTWLQHPTPREKVISSQWVIQRFDPDEISSAVKLLDLRRGIVFVTAKTMPSDVGPLDQIEPVFGTKYRLDKIPEGFITAVGYAQIFGIEHG
jgi:insulysin